MNTQPQTANEYRALELLTEKERATVHRPGGDFVGDFVEALQLKTDASPYLLEAGALMALSLAAGDTVTTPLLVGGDGNLYLNLYILIVGPSTTTRKSTILNSIRAILPRNVHTRQPYIVTVDDTSIQAFNKLAADAGRTMSPLVLTLDEVAGMFAETRKGNSYLAGFDSVLLKLYDHSPVRVARTSGSIEVERGAFVSMFAASTPEPLIDALGTEDISSGLLPRFLVFDATDTVPSRRMTLSERRSATDEYQTRTEALAERLRAISYGRSCGIPTGADPDGTTTYASTSIEWSDEALDRLDELDAHIAAKRGNGDDDGDAILGRSFEQACKLSALYALSRAGLDTTIELGDVLRALNLIEGTAGSLMDMRQKLGGGRQERDISKVEDMLRASPQGRISIARISTVLRLNAWETKSIIDTLHVRQIAKRDGDILMQYHKRTASETKADKARTFIDDAGDWVTSKELDAATGKRGSVAPLIDDLVRTGQYEDEVTTFPKGRRIRRIAG